jgi:hypothetical protein
MREMALQAASVKGSPELQPGILEGAAKDLGDLLQERCVAPSTWVRRVAWDEGPRELLEFLVASETVLEDRVRFRNLMTDLFHRMYRTTP